MWAFIVAIVVVMAIVEEYVITEASSEAEAGLLGWWAYTDAHKTWVHKTAASDGAYI